MFVWFKFGMLLYDVIAVIIFVAYKKNYDKKIFD